MIGVIIGVIILITIVVIAVVASKKSAVGSAASQPPAATDTTVGAQPVITPPAATAGGWNRVEAMNYVWGQVPTAGNSADGNIKYLGTYTTQTDCENSCQGNAWCKAYTWHDGQNGGYNNMCYGMSNIKNAVPEPNHWSGSRKENFNWKTPVANVKEFSNTLMRRAGMSSAGANAQTGEHFGTKSCVGSFDCLKQNFATKACEGSFDCLKQNFRSMPDVAKNTNWSGYQYGAVLPI